MAATLGLGSKALNAGSSAVAPSTRSSKPAPRSSHVAAGTSGQKDHKGRWKGMDAGNDASDDQQDITRGRGMVDELFQGWGGTAGTQNAIMSSTDYMSQAQRSFGNIEDGFYISPAFLDKLSIHIAKNFMNLPKIKVPLILGIWGGKGQGKTFQCMLAFKKLGITPIVMSAGELESGNAGEPAKLIRQRYREASDTIKKGKMCALFINDLDAGAGRFGMSTQYTVNNQMVNATLMNIADNPTNVQLPGVYKNEEIPRVPIICTGNDFSTLYAPLIRDGRMEKYYWNPTREDRIGVCMGIFMEDNLTRGQVEQIVDAFPGQSIDFFGALRARVYDDKVREFVESIGHENLNKRLVNSKEGKVVFEKPQMGIDILMSYGKALVAEQDNVKRVQLADAYLGGAELAGSTGSSVPEGYEGARGLNLEEQRRSWRSTPETPRASAPQQAPAPARESYTPPAPAAPASSERWSRTPASSPGPARGGSAGGAGRTLSASDLAAFKIADLAEIGRKKGVTGGRDATRQSLTDALLKAGISTADLSKGQLAELQAGGSSQASSPAPSSYTPAAPAPAASSGGDRWASYSRSSGGSSSSSGGSAPARGGAGGLSAGDLSSFKIVDLVEIAGKKGVSAGRNPTRESLTDGLVKAGVTLEDLSRGQLVDLAAKLGKAGLSRDLATARAELAGLVGGSGSAAATWRATPAPTASSGGSGGSPPASWRSSGSSSGSSSASSWRTTDSTPAASSGGDRWAKYSTGSSASGGASNVWRRSGSHNASGSKLSAGDLAALRIDDLRDLVKKTGAQLPREPTKDAVISGLVAKGVSLNDLTRGMLVDLSSKLGVSLGRDVDTMRKNLASAVGQSGGYSPAAPTASSAGSSWRTPASSSPASSSSSGGDRWASYSRSSGGSSSGNGAGGAGGLVSERDLSGLKIDTLSELARKKGISMRNATKQDLISQLSRVLKTSDLSKGQAAEIAAASAAPSSGRRW